MYFEQIVRRDIGCAAYLVGSTDEGEAAVVDPRLDMVDEILDVLAREGLRLRYVIETHNHADHVSGHHQLAEATRAVIAVHELTNAAYPHLPLHDGDELALGEVRLRVLHTPGHRPEHIALALLDDTRGDLPWVVLTGDSLFIGDVARPDLAVDGRDGAEALFHSLHEQLLRLPDGTLVYPGHVAGSLCGRVNNRMTGTSIGFERCCNPALAITDQTAFVEYMNESLPERPPNLARIVELNRGATPPTVASPPALDAEQARALLDTDALLLDVRSPEEFGAGHVPGALTVWLDGSQFQNRVGLVVPAETPLVLLAAHDDDATRAATALSVIGYSRVAGYLAGGLDAWRALGGPTATLPSIDPAVLAATLDDTLVLDVRERSEWDEGHLPGAVHLPFYRLDRVVPGLEPDAPVAIICAGGQRSMVAASILRARGFRDVRNVIGGIDAWEAAGLPLEIPGDAADAAEGVAA